jgi:CCR4-NOT transcription complex subunit 7/8
VPLPENDKEFFAILLKFFPCIYDIKHLIHTFDDLHGGLGNIASQVLLTDNSQRILQPFHPAS